MSRTWLTLLALWTIAVAATWAGTGFQAYTKFEVVEQVPVQLDPDDPLVQAGFYEGEAPLQTVTRREFHLGFLPVAQGLLDKHFLSVMTLGAPPWGALVLLWWFQRRRERAHRAAAHESLT